jgi:catechol 2,3-dioxygenase-like lactoylglutathione lyase family enzyme
VPESQGVGHIALTVTDLARSVGWYERVLGGRKLADMELFPGHNITLVLACGTLIGLHRDDRVKSDDRFDEFRVGLDHIGFNCKDRAALEEWQAKLDEERVENSGINEASYGYALVFRDPDNVQLEFFAPLG